jgi:hypothetical protein
MEVDKICPVSKSHLDAYRGRGKHLTKIHNNIKPDIIETRGEPFFIPIKKMIKTDFTRKIRRQHLNNPTIIYIEVPF